MFEEVNEQNPSVASSSELANESQASASPSEPAVQDIFASVDSATPVAPINQQPFGQPATSTGTNNGLPGGSPNKPTSKIKVLLIVLIGLIIIVAGALVYWQYFRQPINNNLVPESVVDQELDLENDFLTDDYFSDDQLDFIDNEWLDDQFDEPLVDGFNDFLEADDSVASDPLRLESTETILDLCDPAYPLDEIDLELDSDGDGLTDYEEICFYQTNPLNPDTDGDGLTDYEEINIYKTDPLNPDTDGDGYLDGEEVRNGHNPLVPANSAR